MYDEKETKKSENLMKTFLNVLSLYRNKKEKSEEKEIFINNFLKCALLNTIFMFVKITFCQ